jgi:mono/diheme cytochrome c family protein
VHPQQPNVEVVTVLVHAVGIEGPHGRAARRAVAVAGRRRPCGQVAQRVTESSLADLTEQGAEAHLVCGACHQPVTLADLSIDSTYTPLYRPPKGAPREETPDDQEAP